MTFRLTGGIVAPLAAIAAFSLSLSTAAFSENDVGGSGRAQSARTSAPPGTPQVDRTRDRDTLQAPSADRDRDQDRLRTPDQSRDRLHDPDQDRDRMRDRDQQQVNRVVDGQLSSLQLLTSSERQQFHAQMAAAATREEQNRIRSEHQALIRERAGDLGVDAPFGPDRSANGGAGRGGYLLAQMLTEQERLQFHQRMRSAGGSAEQQQIRNEMQHMARERAREMGVDIPEWYGAGNGQR